jgi:hypothetical protein
MLAIAPYKEIPVISDNKVVREKNEWKGGGEELGLADPQKVIITRFARLNICIQNAIFGKF